MKKKLHSCCSYCCVFCVVVFCTFLCTSLSPFSGLALAIRDQEYHGFLFANVSHDGGQLVDVAAVEMLCLPQVQDHRGWARFGCKETHVSAQNEDRGENTKIQWGKKVWELSCFFYFFFYSIESIHEAHIKMDNLSFFLHQQSYENLFSLYFIVLLRLVILSVSSFIVCYIATSRYAVLER